MAHGQNATARGHNREYWSRRPYAGWSWGKSTKTLTHRHERRVGKKDIVREILREIENAIHEGHSWP